MRRLQAVAESQLDNPIERGPRGRPQTVKLDRPMSGSPHTSGAAFETSCSTSMTIDKQEIHQPINVSSFCNIVHFLVYGSGTRIGTTFSYISFPPSFFHLIRSTLPQFRP